MVDEFTDKPHIYHKCKSEGGIKAVCTFYNVYVSQVYKLIQNFPLFLFLNGPSFTFVTLDENNIEKPENCLKKNLKLILKW